MPFLTLAGRHPMPSSDNPKSTRHTSRYAARRWLAALLVLLIPALAFLSFPSGASGDTLARIRWCESRSDYQEINERDSELHRLGYVTELAVEAGRIKARAGLAKQWYVVEWHRGAWHTRGSYGAYQFAQTTWNWVAYKHRHYDWIGIRPDKASRYQQDHLAWHLAVHEGGIGTHWAHGGRC